MFDDRVRYHAPKCYYCICTVCDSLTCPFRRYVLQCCYNCSEKGEYRPRLDCSFFKHFKKSKQYRIRKVTHSLKTLYNVRFSGLGSFSDVSMDKILALSKRYPVEFIEVSRCVQDLHD